jgi:NADPH-dependent ferric siderophore reductase
VALRVADAVTAGADQRIKVLLTPPDGGELRLPTGPEWYAEWYAVPAEQRFIMRTYTVRSLRAESGPRRHHLDRPRRRSGRRPEVGARRAQGR